VAFNRQEMVFDSAGIITKGFCKKNPPGGPFVNMDEMAGKTHGDIWPETAENTPGCGDWDPK
jgi:hypothetical protein